MEKEFVSYKQAVALRELGFSDECLAHYDYYGRLPFPLVMYGDCECCDNSGEPAPLKQQVFRWFREYYWWYANLSSWLQEEEGTYHEYEIYGTPDSAHGSIMFKTYEEAENACIDKLILIAKQQDNGR